MHLRFILFILLIGSSVTAQVINRAEYFIDADPGNANGTDVVISSPSASVIFSFTVPTASLASGFHILGFRSRQSSSGFWSHATYSTFYVVPALTFQTAVNITQAEYFFDADPGNGLGVNVPVSASPSIAVAFNTPTAALGSGFHTLHFRTKDNLNQWSIAHIQTFYIVPPPATASSINLTKAEYFFDNDPGNGNGIPLTIAAGSPQNNSFPIPITGLTEGFHRLNVRYKDNANTWSHAHQQMFYITPQNSLPATNVTRVEYYVDTDPGYGQATAATITLGPNVDLLPLPINTTGISSGNHVLYVRAKDDKGFWSDLTSGPFTISNCIPPPQPIVANQSRCDVGTVTFTATGATGTQEYHWYDDAIAGTQVGSGSPFTTASLSATKTFYATIFDPSTSCESARVAVNATVITFPKPSLNTSGTITLCEGGSVFLQAPSGYNVYKWSGGQTTQQITASASGSYSVSVGDGSGCFSANSDAVTLTLVPAPAKPIVQITGDLCSGGSVVLSGPTGFEYLWSTGATTQDITVSQAGVFTLSTRNSTGCQSVSSDAVTFLGSQAQAQITLVDNKLVATPGDAYQWFRDGVAIAGATSQTLEIDLLDFTIYSVHVTNDGCVSASADFIYLITAAEKDAASIHLYPNPASEKLFIELPKPVDKITLLDPLGKRSYEASDVNKGLHTINVSTLAAGLYYLVIKSHDDVIVFKVQKQ